jgi:hypothetical protein
MTFAEKFKKDNPNAVTTYAGCPYQFGYVNDPRCPNDDGVQFTCDECWDREMPGTEPVERIIDDPIIEDNKAKIAALKANNEESASYNHDPTVNCANCEKHEEEIARLNARILEDKEYIDKLREKIKDRNEELDLYRLIVWTIEATLKIELPDVHSWMTHD